jgi:sugar diacid utilization regulator/putative methionine-R-sulfoxide reductase with GAF domain
LFEEGFGPLQEPGPPSLLLDDDSNAAPAVDLDPKVLSQMVELSRELQAEEIDLSRLLPLIAQQAPHLLRCDIAWIGLFHPERQEIRIVTAHGTRVADFEEMRVSFGEGIGGVALRRGMTLVVSDYVRYEHTTPSFVRSTIEREGISSLMCAPMKHGDGFVGVLYVGNRRRTRFGAAHVSLLAMLAGQASVAIRNGRLYQNLREKTETLESTFEINRRLHDAAANDDLQGVLHELASVTGRPLKLEQDHVMPFTLVAGGDGDEDDDPTLGLEPAALFPVVLARRQVGRVVAYGPGELSDLENNALNHGASVIALELMKHHAAHQVEWELRGEMLEDLLDGGTELSDSRLARAKRLGVDLTAPHQVLVVEAPSTEDADFARLKRRLTGPRFGQRSGVLVAHCGPHLVIAVIGDTVRSHALAQMLIEEAGETMTLSIGVSSCRTGRFAQSRREAAACATFGAAAGRKSVVIDHAELGPLRFMLDASSTDSMRSLVEECLADLDRYDREHASQLLLTLRAYLEEDGHHRSIATRCHVHPSTVKYRLSRIGQILDRDLGDVATRFQLSLAMQLLDLFRLVGSDLLASGTGSAPATDLSH